MITGRRFRAELTEDQVAFAERTGAVCRAVWNTGLAQRREYRRRSAWISYQSQAKELAEAKSDHRWLAEVPGHCLQQTLMDLEKACRRHGTFKVRWRSGRYWLPSFRFPDGKTMKLQSLNRRHARIKLTKFGWVKFRCSRSLKDEIVRSVTLSREGQCWYVSLLVEDGRKSPAAHSMPSAAVGLDRGVAVALATSDGDLIDRTFLTPGEQRRSVVLQRKLSRSARRSINRNKIRAALMKIRARERHRRQDFCARAAHRLTAANALVVIEDLKTINMTRSSKGTIARPGRNVKAKSGLNRAILAKGWHQFALALASSSRYTGTTVVVVPAAYTSQRCSACQHVDPKSRENQTVFRCCACGRVEHADVNAAKNILAAGLAAIACEDHSQPAGETRSAKQELAGNREELLPDALNAASVA